MTTLQIIQTLANGGAKVKVDVSGMYPSTIEKLEKRISVLRLLEADNREHFTNEDLEITFDIDADELMEWNAQKKSYETVDFLSDNWNKPKIRIEILEQNISNL